MALAMAHALLCLRQPRRQRQAGLRGQRANGLNAREGRWDALTVKGCSETCFSAPRSDAAAATRQRLEEAAVKREQELRDKAAQRYERREYKCGLLTLIPTLSIPKPLKRTML